MLIRMGPAAVPDDVKDILMHNKPVCVRRNLWDFLHTMRQARVEGYAQASVDLAWSV